MPNRAYTVVNIGPRKMTFEATDINVVPPVPQALTLDAVGSAATHNGREVKMYYGIGKLSELVEMYRSRRDLLFSKNVRYFLAKKSNLEKGPSGRMRETLKDICIDATLEPELFSFFHNGVTIYAEHVDVSEGELQLRAPYVLNGCQTDQDRLSFCFGSQVKESYQGRSLA